MENMPRYYCITILIIVLRPSDVVCRSLLAEEGPYELFVHNTSSCIQEQKWLRTNITTYTSKGRNLIRGTVVAEREMKNTKFRIQAFYALDDGMVKTLEIKNQNCHNILVRLILQIIGIPYNPQTCVIKPVTTEFNNMDVDSIAHSVLQSTWYGVLQIRMEISVSGVRVTCHNIYMNSIKLSNKKA